MDVSPRESMSLMKNMIPAHRVFALLAVLAVSACGDSPFQVIEEVTFDPSLGIDLTQMTRLDSGVYIQDMVVGTGETVIDGTVASLSYVAYLADGTQFGQGTFNFVVGNGGVIAGFEEGVGGMNVGGERRIIIPPALGYANEDQPTIPPGSVLIFDVVLDDLQT